MEKIVRIMSQSPLATRQYTDRKTGVEKVMNSVALHLTDGVDNFIAEITGERAVNLPVLRPRRDEENDEHLHRQNLRTVMKKLVKTYKSNTRLYDDDSIEVTPQQQGEPTQKDVKKVGRSKRYATTSKNPLMCIELKCPDDVVDKAAFFQEELNKLTRDIEIAEPKMERNAKFLVNDEDLKVCFVKNQKLLKAFLQFHTEGLLDVRRVLYNLTSKIDKCLVINETLICPQKQ